ncbi:tRNA-SAD domain-containing protein [Mycena kentingensis (nom. inval.)]|nr:tRNA-SAD domain-containing protein [Mycena kentingensis (nom. inval.)]
MAAADSEYHRILSDSLRSWIYTDSSQYSTPVGLLACQRNPLLRQNDAVIVSTALSALTQPKLKGKKAVNAPEISADTVTLELSLSDTVLFPEGGGQPTCTGILRTQDGTIWPVLKVLRVGGTAVHYVQVLDAEQSLKILCPGARVRVELDDRGWDRRVDHMSLHTSQHLLSALLETRLQLPTLSWSLTAFPAPCYVEVPRGMTADEIALIQREANQLVFEGRKVHVEVQELDRATVKPVDKTESGRAVGRGLPEDYTGGVHRVVVIDGVDRNPCCGTHLPSLNNLQLFILPHTDALSRSATTVARLYFFAGPRLIHYLTSTHNSLSVTASLLSCGLVQVPERVQLVVDERKNATKRVDDLQLELAKYVATELASELQRCDLALESAFKKHIHRLDDSLPFLTSIAGQFTNTVETGRPYVLVFSSSPTSQALTNTNVVFVVGSDDAIVRQVGDGLKTKAGVKGGGKGTRWSGKVVGTWKAKEDTLIEEVLAAV